MDREAAISECWVYGIPGQTQFGLDILAARNQTPSEFACYQCKRVKEFSGEDIKKAVDKFLKGKWADKARSFVLCTSSALSRTEQVDEIAAQHSRLAAKNIEFHVWDGSEGGQLTERLKSHPDLVDDFFLREWVRRFNGEEAAKSLGEKLDGVELEKLRSQLYEVYTTLFLRHDQGLRLGTQRPASLLKRYIAPAVIESRNITTSESPTDSPIPRQGEQNPSGTEMQHSRRPRVQSTTTQEIRIPVGEWFSRHDRSVVLGEPGYGKSTLLRVIALQLLSKRDDPFQTPWSKLLPVWISFGGFSSVIQAQPNLNLEDYFDSWLHQNAADDIRPLFRRAVREGEMLLLVDGLDEGQDINAAKQAMDRISAFLAIRSTPAVFTSRPRGYERVRPDGAWPVTRLGAFDEKQIEQFANMWFEYLEAPEIAATEGRLERSQNLHQRTKEFLKATQANPRIVELARTPLFCQLLIDIFRYSHHLPEQRIKVYEKIVEMLLSDHPAARTQAAGLSNHTAPRSEDMREMLMRVALHIQESGGAGVITIADCQATFCAFLTDDLNGPGLTNYEAKHQAQLITDYALSGLGLIVERSPNELGFFHLTIQEYLAAQAMVRKDEEEQLTWLASVWNQPQWHEVILAWFSVRGTDQGKGATQRAIDRLKESAATPWEKIQLLLLRTELAANDLGLSPREARSTIDEAADQVETTPFQKLRQALAGQIAQGLRSPSVANTCENRIANWVPARSVWDRAKLIKALGNWKPFDDLLHILKLALHDEAVSCRRAAAESLARIFASESDLGNELAQKAKNWPDTGVRAAALHGLWKGWPDHYALDELAVNACRSRDADLALTGIAIRISRGLRSEDDRQKIWHMFTNGTVSYELRDTCREVLVQGWGKDEEFKRLALDELCNPYNHAPFDKERLISFLAHSWPGDTEVAHSIAGYFLSFSPSHIRDESFWEAMFTGFRGNPELSSAIRKDLEERRTKYQAIYWGPDAKRAYSVIGDDAAKSELLAAYLTETDSLHKYWIISTLMDVWHNDDTVTTFLSNEFLKPPGEVAFLATWAHSFVPEKEARRSWLLKAARTADGRDISAPVSHLLDEFGDDECLAVVKEALSKNVWYYHKIDFQSRLIAAFPNDHDVQTWIESAFANIDGPSIASIATSHEGNPAIRPKLLMAARPARSDARAEVFRVIREHPIPPETVQRLTASIFAEDSDQIRTSGVLARCIAAQQLPELMEPLLGKLHEELDSSGHYFQKRRRSAFSGFLLLGKYETCIDVLTKGSPSALHWLAEYHEADSLTSRTLFEHWDELHNASQALGKAIEMPWGGLIYNGTASEALVNSSARSQLITYLKIMPLQDRTPESLTLMAELLPGSNELRTCLLEMINDRGSSFHRGNISEAQRIYAEQFGGDSQALNDLGDAWAPSSTDVATPPQPISNFLYALALGWPDTPALQALLKQDEQPKLPIHIALSLCSITGDEMKALACIERMIEATWEWGRALPVQYQQGLRKWAFSPSAEALLQNLIVDPDCSRKITALKLLAISGKLKNESRLEMIGRFNEYLEGAVPVPDGLDVLDGKVTTLAQAIAEEFLIASA
ncbi:MAG: NACHT domain-containing protein [Burkholderiales bacterium]|nr:NACHT domain-containing protein [Burkholderiales bacterium]